MSYMYIENCPFLCTTTITQKSNSELDAYELLIYLRDNEIPEDENMRIGILKTLSQTALFIIYEDVCKYSESFKNYYTTEYIKSLLRRYKIKGINLYKEIEIANMNEEEKYLLYFFFKGKVR